MGSTSVAIELLSDRVDVVAFSGDSVVSSIRLPVDLPGDPTSWAKAVRAIGGSVKKAVQELNVDCAGTRVFYRSPTQSVNLVSANLRSAAQACAAAILPAADSLPYSASAAIVDAAVVGRDAKGPEPRWHVVVAADRVDVLRAIIEMTETAGLKFESAMPLDAAILAAVVRRALSFAGPQHGWLYFGTYSSFFILGGDGRVHFERSIGLGTETIVQALARPIRIPDEEPITLDVETARTIFHEHGIPETDEILGETARLTRRHLMPQIQPVLQRYVVELRQSLRFGLPEGERQSIEITVSGPGSTIHGLTDLIAMELKIKFTASQAVAGYDYTSPATAGGELLEALGDRTFLNRLNLQPKETAIRQQAGRLRRWLWTGAAAAMVVIVADSVQLGFRLAAARERSDTLQSAAVEAVALQKTHDKIVDAIGAMRTLEKVIAIELGSRIDLGAILHELSRLTPKSIKLNSLRLVREKGRFTARLYGRAIQVDPKTGQTEVEAFISALKTSPLFHEAGLRNVERRFFAAGGGERFEASFEAVAAPDPGVSGVAVAFGEEGDSQ